MLDRADGYTAVVTDHGAQREILDVPYFRRDVGDDAPALADEEAQARISIRGMQHESDRRTTVHAFSLELDLAVERRLSGRKY